MKKVIGFLGSPRPKKNTWKLMNEIMRGAESAGAGTEIIHVSALKMTGCKGCYSCKKEGKNFGKCVLNDDMKPLYDKINDSDAVVLGSPVYMCAMTPELKMILDRMFPYITMNIGSILKPGKKCVLVFTQNQEDPKLFQPHFDLTAFMLKHIGFESVDIIVSTNTIGYNESDVDSFGVKEMRGVHAAKMKYNSEVFPKEMEKAFKLGKALVN